MRLIIQKSKSDYLAVFIGFLAVFYSNIVVPIYITMGLTVVLFFICLYKNNFKFSIRECYVLMWYGLFALLTIIALLYTCNKENPEYTIRRVLIIFAIILMGAMRLKREKNILDSLKGIVYGSLLLCFISFLLEIRVFGFGERIGSLVTGSATSFSGLLLIGFIAAFFVGFKENFTNKLYPLCGMVFFFFILASGSRKPTILCAFYLIAMLLVNPEVKKSKKIVYLLVFGLIITLFFEVTSIVGEYTAIISKRLESMMNSFFGTNDDASMLERTIMRKYGITLFLEKPILGWGTHGFAERFNQYYGKLLYSHCGFVEILSCYGIVGFVIYYRPFVLTIKKYLDTQKNNNTFFKSFFCIYIFMTFVTEYYSISFYGGAITLMLTIGFLVINGYVRE